MPTPEHPTSPASPTSAASPASAAACADAVQSALRELAHATRRIDDPREVYSILGSLTAAVASLSQSLHQVAAVHEHPPSTRAWHPRPSRGTRVATHEAVWELHRAAEMLEHVNNAIAGAHNAEATITYEPRTPHPPPTSPRSMLRAPEPGHQL